MSLFSFQEASKTRLKVLLSRLKASKKSFESANNLNNTREDVYEMRVSKKGVEPPKRRHPPATTPEARENQLIALAVDLAESQLSQGTASSQVITHYLKLGSTKERIEKEILEKQKELIQAKTNAIQSAKRVEELYTNALSAMRSYSGQGEPDD